MLRALLLTLLPLISFAQSGLYNAGPDLTFYVGKDHEVHVDGDVDNAANATMQFDTIGTPTISLDGDFTNSTSGIYTMGTELISFVGSTAQNADWGGDIFYSANINNSNNVNLLRNGTVSSSIVFNDGDLNTTGTEVITFDTAAFAVGPSDDSHVNGPVAKNFNSTTEWEFPVGNGTFYRDIYLELQSTTATNYEIEYFRVQYPDTSVDGTIDHISRREYYTIDRNSGSEDATIRMTWRSNSEVTNTSDIVVAYYNGTDWSTAGGNNRTGDATSGSVESNAYWSTWANRPFTLASTTTNNPLPIEMLAFTAERANDHSVLNWTTVTEINSDYFSIQHSTDGQNFTEIGTLNAAGNSTEMIDYDFTHTSPNKGVNYYKIVNYDFDGSFEASVIRTVIHSDTKINLRSLSKLYPNPTSNDINLDYYLETEEYFTVMIYDEIGNLVSNQNIDGMEGLNQITIRSSNFASGNYYVRVIELESNHSEQFTFTKAN
jgi:hypothetical protein